MAGSISRSFRWSIGQPQCRTIPMLVMDRASLLVLTCEGTRACRMENGGMENSFPKYTSSQQPNGNNCHHPYRWHVLMCSLAWFTLWFTEVNRDPSTHSPRFNVLPVAGSNISHTNWIRLPSFTHTHVVIVRPMYCSVRSSSLCDPDGLMLLRYPCHHTRSSSISLI